MRNTEATPELLEHKRKNTHVFMLDWLEREGHITYSQCNAGLQVRRWFGAVTGHLQTRAFDYGQDRVDCRMKGFEELGKFDAGRLLFLTMNQIRSDVPLINDICCFDLPVIAIKNKYAAQYRASYHYAIMSVISDAMERLDDAYSNTMRLQRDRINAAAKQGA